MRVASLTVVLLISLEGILHAQNCPQGCQTQITAVAGDVKTLQTETPHFTFGTIKFEGSGAAPKCTAVGNPQGWSVTVQGVLNCRVTLAAAPSYFAANEYGGVNLDFKATKIRRVDDKTFDVGPAENLLAPPGYVQFMAVK